MSLSSSVTHSPLGCGCAACAAIANDESQKIGGESIDSAPIGANYASLLGSGNYWNHANGGQYSNGKLVVEYQFFNSTPSYYSSNMHESSGFQKFTNSMKSATVQILNEIETFTNLSFSLSNGSNGDTDIGFGQATLTADAGAWAYYPSWSSFGGDVWTNRMYASDTQNVNEGTYGYFVLLHEIGHALGLQHTFSAGLSGETNTEKYSVMAYDFSSWGSLYAESYMLYDIKALQNVYGINTDYNAGDTTYTLQSGRAYTIWDGGGTDTLSGAHISSNMIISLVDGSYSSVGQTENIAIAYGATIENAIGGKGNDVIYGNTANNTISGGKGNDTFYASGGNDVYNGGSGTDAIIYENAISNYTFIEETSGTFTIQYNNNTAYDIVGGVENFYFNGVKYSSATISFYYAVDPNVDSLAPLSLTGTGKSEIINGGLSGDNITGIGGKDLLYGGAGDDILIGGGSKDQLYGEDGDDTITGAGSKIYISGGAGDDDITANGASKSTILGGDGDDTVDASGSKSKIYTNSGSDDVTFLGGKSAIVTEGGSDTVNATGSKLTILTGNGNDTIIATGGKIGIDAGAGNDTITIEGSKISVVAGDGNDDITVGIGSKNGVSGGNGNDTFSVQSYNKTTIVGDNGDDMFNIDGGSGSSLFGGNGSDTYVFNVAGSVHGIGDFNVNQDHLDISNILSGYDDTQDAIEDFLMFTASKKSTYLFIDTNGGGDSFELLAAFGKTVDLSDLETLEDNGTIIT